MTVQVVHRGEDAVAKAARDLIECWLTDEEIHAELIGRFPWISAGQEWVSDARRRLQDEGRPIPSNHDLHLLMALAQ
ncbi:MAG: hypothetical protein U1E46_11705 [Hyphomicrobiales bacterium]